MMYEFDEAVLDAFLKNQKKLFPKGVALTREEADDFLGECMAVVAGSAEEVWEYFEEEGVDIAGMDAEEILQADEVFAVGDGRYLIVEC